MSARRWRSSAASEASAASATTRPPTRATEAVDYFFTMLTFMVTRRLRLVVGAARHIGDGRDDVRVGALAEDGVAAVERRVRLLGDEELRARRVGARPLVGHRQDARLVEFQ